MTTTTTSTKCNWYHFKCRSEFWRCNAPSCRKMYSICVFVCFSFRGRFLNIFILFALCLYLLKIKKNQKCQLLQGVSQYFSDCTCQPLFRFQNCFKGNPHSKMLKSLTIRKLATINWYTNHWNSMVDCFSYTAHLAMGYKMNCEWAKKWNKISCTW